MAVDFNRSARPVALPTGDGTKKTATRRQTGPKPVGNMVQAGKPEDPQSLPITSEAVTGTQDSEGGNMAEKVKRICRGVSVSDESGPISEANHMLVRRKIHELCMVAFSSGANCPIFENNELIDGKIIFTAANDYSKTWFLEKAKTLGEMWEGANLKVTPLDKKPSSHEKIIMCFQECQEGNSVFMKLLKHTNPGLETSNWKLWGRIRQERSVRITCGVDKSSLEYIRAHNNFLYYTVCRVKVLIPSDRKPALKRSTEEMEAEEEPSEPKRRKNAASRLNKKTVGGLAMEGGLNKEPRNSKVASGKADAEKLFPMDRIEGITEIQKSLAQISMISKTGEATNPVVYPGATAPTDSDVS